MAPKDPKKSNFASFKQFMYNSDEGSFCGRTCSSWAQIGAFYFVFYAFLAGFFVAWLAIFFVFVDSNYPSQQGMNTMLKNNPGMGFRPQPDLERTLLRFTQGLPSSYQPYTQHLKTYLENYENEKQEGENYIDCTNLAEEDREATKVCKFDLIDLGEECTWQNEYGYDEGQPCVLLKLNKIYGWLPPLYTNTTQPPANAELGNRWDETHIAVNCHGENPADQENMGPIKFWPEHGWSQQFYPYLNQEGYLQPLVMVQFQAPKNGVLIQVMCKVWVQGIIHNKNDNAGGIHFELLVD